MPNINQAAYFGTASGAWVNCINKLWQCLLWQFYNTLPKLTLPNQFSIPFLNPARGYPTLDISCQIIFNNLPKFGKNKFGTAKGQLHP
jgi:hypothetical protein